MFEQAQKCIESQSISEAKTRREIEIIVIVSI